MNTDPKRSSLRAKPAREPKRISIRVSGFVWTIIGAVLVGGVLNTIGWVTLAVIVGLTSGK